MDLEADRKLRVLFLESMSLTSGEIEDIERVENNYIEYMIQSVKILFLGSSAYDFYLS